MTMIITYVYNITDTYNFTFVFSYQLQLLHSSILHHRFTISNILRPYAVLEIDQHFVE